MKRLLFGKLGPRLRLNLPQDVENLAATEFALAASQRIQRGCRQGQRDMNQSLERRRGKCPGVGFRLYEMAPCVLVHLLLRPCGREKIYAARQVLRAVAQDID